MKNITWIEFARLINSGNYVGGFATSREDEGTFSGPIDAIAADEEGTSVGVKPCAVNGEIVYPEGRLISAFGYKGVAEPTVDENGQLSYYVYLIGSVDLYPKGHPMIPDMIDNRKQPAEV